MTVTTPIANRALDNDTRALFEEARRRRRRRWLVAGVVVLVLVLGGIIVGVAATRGSYRGATIPASATNPAPSVQSSRAATPGATELVWFASGGLHLGYPGQGTNRVVAQPNAAGTRIRLVHIGGRVYFLERRSNGAPGQNGGNQVAELDTYTGRVRLLGAGINLTTTTDGRDLLVALDPVHLVELSPTGARLSRVWTIPSGYTLDTYAGQRPLAAVAGGIVVQSARPASVDSGFSALAIWYPNNGSVRVLGRDAFVIGSYTRPGANRSLIAWVDGSPAGIDSYRLAITDTATLETRLISSPLQGAFSSTGSSTGMDFGHNFVGGGGFSPDGRQLAAFVTTFRPHDWPDAQLVLVNSSNGSVRLITNTVVQIGGQAWATWSPTGNELFGGSYREGAVIQAFELKAGQTQATPLSLDKNANDDVTGSAVSIQGSKG
jgi:hypothetical protein